MAARGERGPRRELDAAWKSVPREFLPEFVAFARPDLHAAIGWSRAPEFLDKELQAVARRAATGRRDGDLLAKLWRVEGKEEWLLVHVEVQARHEDAFDQRMYLYHSLLYLRHRRPIVSMAILIDARAEWRAGEYAYDHWGCALQFQYPTMKLLDFAGREGELRRSDNPFAQIALVQLAALTSRGRQGPLIATRFAVLRHLLRAGWDDAKALAMLDFLDRVLDLPDTLVAQIDAEVAAEEQMARTETPDRPITSWERFRMRQGQQELLEQMLEQRFGPLGGERRERLSALPADRMPTLGLALRDFTSMADFDRWLARRRPRAPRPEPQDAPE